MRPMKLARLALSLAVGLSPVPVAAQEARAPAPAPATKAATASRAMVSAANPLAAAAGLEVLKAGGGAVDAAVAIQAVLGLVEPQSSGLGGGAFLIHYDAQTKAVTAYNGRETAPRGAGPAMFLGADGKPLPFGQAVISGRATGVPGAVAMLALAHADHGKLAWKDLFGTSRALATDGFVVTPRLARFINGGGAQSRTPDATAYFTKPDGTRYQVGDRLKNPVYAATPRASPPRGHRPS